MRSEARLAAWSETNDTPGRPWLIWQWSQRGFGSELLTMLRAMLHAAETGRSFRLSSKRGNISINAGWTDWFEPFCPTFEHPALFRRKAAKSRGLVARVLSLSAKRGWIGPRGSILTHDVFKKIWPDSHYMRQFRIPYLGIDGHLEEACSALLHMIWRMRNEVSQEIEDQLSSLSLPDMPYAALHVRRGDKRSENAHTSTAKYIEYLEDKCGHIKTICVATDDYAMIGELQRHRPNIDWRTLAPSCRRGHYQDHFNRNCLSERRREIVGLFAEIEMMRRSDFFIGTASSNLGRVMTLFRSQESCAFVDMPLLQFSVIDPRIVGLPEQAIRGKCA